MGDAQDGDRKNRVHRLSALIYENCIQNDLERFQSTGSVLPTSSLRHRSTRDCLHFAKSLQGRWFTKAMVKDALSHLLSVHQPKLPEVPGFSLESWLEQQTKCLQPLLARARRSTVQGGDQEGQVVEGAMAENPDNAETQAWQPDSSED